MSGQDPSSGVARYLVSCAARKAPSGLSARLEEEWLADLTARRGTFSRLRFGLGCCWATRVIAREFGAVAATAAGGSASGERLLVAYGGGFDFSRLSRRTVALIVIVSLHVAAFYAYLSGVTQRLVDGASSPIHGAVILDHRIHKSEVLRPPKLMVPTFDSFPTPRIPLDFPPDPKMITVPRSTLPYEPPVPLQRPKPVERVTGGPGAGFPDTEDYYPPAARRLDEAGAAAVRVCVDPNGRLTADPAIVQSSGIARIDGGALRLARAGSGHYRPTTENGRPVSSCYAFRVRFRLQDE